MERINIQRELRGLELLAALNDAIEEAISENAERADCWRENQITCDWLKAMVRALRQQGSQPGFANIKIAAYKQSGQLETDHGDVAVQAIITPHGADDAIRGYAFLEAKKSGFSGPFHYREFRQEQLDRVSRGTSQHRYLFYRREPRFPEGLYTAFLIPWMHHKGEFRVRSSACPTYLVPGFSKPLGDAVFEAGMPLAIQIFRYCHGWDLDVFPPKSESLPIPEGVPFLLSISANYNDEHPPEPLAVPESFEELDDDDDRPMPTMRS